MASDLTPSRAPPKTGLCDLPREVVHQYPLAVLAITNFQLHKLIEGILSYLPTRNLVLIAPTSHTFYSAVSYLVHQRVRDAIAVEDYHLIYECYLPSEKLPHPYN